MKLCKLKVLFRDLRKSVYIKECDLLLMIYLKKKKQ